jgi:hypothetical protein
MDCLFGSGGQMQLPWMTWARIEIGFLPVLLGMTSVACLGFLDVRRRM